MTREQKIAEMSRSLTHDLLARQSADGMWRGHLSSSAVSTSVAIFALWIIDRKLYAKQIEKGAIWLHNTMLPEGTWGDSPESGENLTATLLAYSSLMACDKPSAKTQQYLSERFGGLSDKDIISGVLHCYGDDLTFSAPILVMCALAGVIDSWDKIPQLPFELSVVPQRFFRFLRLPVVSYAIPALIAVGILRYKRGKRVAIREMFIPKSLKVLEKLQPPHGGFLEAAPLTAFVSMCICAAGYSGHVVAQRAALFLTDTVRDDGSWSIDTDLSSWVTSLCVKALGDDIEDPQKLYHKIRSNAFGHKHVFTGARPGGWGWSDLLGAVPDADDTAAALIALHTLGAGVYCDEVGAGVEWLLELQNRDGGIPTFCKGWGKLPFDRSSPDISAHTLKAFELWQDKLPARLRARCRRSIGRIVRWLASVQRDDGSWLPLWFGDQDAPGELAPVYGTAVAVEYLNAVQSQKARHMASRGAKYLKSVQNSDGGWGGARGVGSKVTLTSSAIAALATSEGCCREQMDRGIDYLYSRHAEGTLGAAEPIGLYFATLWYSEQLYNITFALSALKRVAGNT